jgi:hypothetical protein
MFMLFSSLFVFSPDGLFRMQPWGLINLEPVSPRSSAPGFSWPDAPRPLFRPPLPSFTPERAPTHPTPSESLVPAYFALE